MSAPRTRFVGHLVADPEVIHTNNGTPVCKIRVAVDGGGRNMEAGYYNVVEYDKPGEASFNQLTMGWCVEVDGRLEHRSWKDKETDKWREAIDIVGRINWIHAPATEEEKAARAAAADGPTDLPPVDASAKPAPVPAGVRAAADDDIPF
jgi:single-strand DNA-binding protein